MLAPADIRLCKDPEGLLRLFQKLDYTVEQVIVVQEEQARRALGRQLQHKGRRTRQPLAFVLHTPGATRPDGRPQGDADYLAAPVDKVKVTLGVDHLDYILFDKGFWSQTLFQQLVAGDETLITPGKQFKTIRQAVAAVAQGAQTWATCAAPTPSSSGLHSNYTFAEIRDTVIGTQGVC